jgi:hypothetical protein
MSPHDYYVFAVNSRVKLGKRCRFSGSQLLSPQFTVNFNWFDVRELMINAPIHGFIENVVLSIGMKSYTFADGLLSDDHDPSRRISELRDTVHRDTLVKVEGDYTGLVPDGYTSGFEYTLSFCLRGCAVKGAAQ